MPLKTKRELESEAVTLATSFSYVLADHAVYAPTDYETGDQSVTPPVDRKIWTPLTLADFEVKAKTQFGTTFFTDAETANFRYMVEQHCIREVGPFEHLMIRTSEGLRVLGPDGLLSEPTGAFIPNTLKPMLNEDPADKEEMFQVLAEWVDSEEEAHALLRLLATSLAPHWSAGKYVLLIGNGRNGKSVLMEMLRDIFGAENCSSVSRQEMNAAKPQVTNLNGKLVNIVFDGSAEYLKDSGIEKTLVVGETAQVRRLFKSDTTSVKTNALFLEALNQEPKAKDKSTALQSRIVRFFFPNVYSEDRMFMRKMLSERFLGALLALLIEHYVKEEEIGVMLAPTATSFQLELEYSVRNSLALQFIKHVEDATTADDLIGLTIEELAAQFKSWRIKENDLSIWSEPDIQELFRPQILFRRSTRSVNGKTRHVRVVQEFLPRTAAFINILREEADAAEPAAPVVED